jgi:flagellar biosynthesis/type III secretory pathway M-ring protein FliF/YscJ
MPVPAHVGHWLAELMYVAPVLAVVAWISIRSLLDRRQERREAAAREAADRAQRPGAPCDGAASRSAAP